MKIELPDELGATLQAKAAAQGLSLESWFRKLAEPEAERKTLTPQQAVARILELQKYVKPDPEGLTVHDYINQDRS